jgi:hypothetical protein
MTFCMQTLHRRSFNHRLLEIASFFLPLHSDKILKIKSSTIFKIENCATLTRHPRVL